MLVSGVFFLGWLYTGDVVFSYLVAHGETAVVGCGSPNIRDESYVGEVDQIKPAVENEPTSGPVGGDEIFIALTGESPAVDEEEDEDDDDGREDAPPEFLVHCRFDGLLALG